ncbi:uncharacterized protein [Heptranchias perlo]|uniref:uncharacterized protein isoform X1 n=1 Tax=Heptranchias perlo TaxID=212740 RepID=UPI003559C615
MASCKTEKTWSDLQESLNRVRQQLGLVPRTGWNDLVPSDAYLRAHLTSQHNRRKVHSPSYLPRLLITSDGVHNGPSADLRRGLRVVVPPLLNEKANGREEGPRNAVNSGFQQPGNRLKRTDSPDYAMIRPADLPLQNVLSMSPYGGDKESSRTLSQSPGRERQFAACSFFRENKSFAWNFVDSFISEVLRDELVPDALMEVLSGVYTKCPPVYSLTKKNSYIQSKLQQITELDVLKQRPAVSVLDTLLKEIVGELTVRVIRSAVKELVSDHLTTAAITESLTELMAEAIEPVVPHLVKEAVSEMILEGILQDEILPSVLDEETRNVAVLLLSEYHTEISEQQQEEVRTYASRRLIDMLLLENLMKIIGSEGRAFSEKVELDRLLDSWMLDVFFGQYFNISRHNHVTVENVALRDYHQKAFTDVVLDVILTEMSEHVDQDLADLSQYEQEMEEADFTVD